MDKLSGNFRPTRGNGPETNAATTSEARDLLNASEADFRSLSGYSYYEDSTRAQRPASRDAALVTAEEKVPRAGFRYEVQVPAKENDARAGSRYTALVESAERDLEQEAAERQIVCEVATAIAKSGHPYRAALWSEETPLRFAGSVYRRTR